MKTTKKASIQKSKIQVVPKGWGKELWVHNDEKYCGKILVLKKGKRCSLHFHVLKHETFYISKGLVQMELIDKDGAKKTFVMKPGDALEITQGLMHRFTGLEDSEIMEFSTQHFDEDSYRIEKGD
ncbi:MAG: cupin domain-containing protein [bacterium]|nr:cupin domain-containing protein [bacterium]